MGYSTDNTEFIDHEIVKAFKFFDKDNNGFIDDTVIVKFTSFEIIVSLLNI